MMAELTPRQAAAIRNVAASFAMEGMPLDEYDQGVLADYARGLIDGPECERLMAEHARMLRRRSE